MVTPWSQTEALLSAAAPTVGPMPTPQKRTRSDGTTSWRVRFRINGKQIGETFYSPHAAGEFCDWIRLFGPARALELLRAQTPVVDTSAVIPTLDEWAARYIDSLAGASGSTKAGYRSSYRHSFGKHLGHIRLDLIDRETIARTIGTLQKTGGRAGNGYADKTIANQHGLLSAMFDTAVADRIIDTSPCVNVRLPRSTEHTDTPKRFLTEDEFATLWQHAGEHHRPLLETLVGTGIRWGEAEALTVADVDLKRRLLSINKAAKWSGVKRTRIIGPTKTPRSRRTISLPAELVETLEKITRGRALDERLFLAPRGGPLGHKVFWSSVWLPACERAQLADPRPRIHDLRHTHASWLIAEGVSMKALQERLGHESIKTTMDLYAHLMPGALQETADAASRALARALPGRGKVRAA
jgi:integrase